MPCAIRECNRTAKHYGICGAHWRRIQNGKNVLQDRPSQAERFERYVDRRGPEECWPWVGPMRPDGYGYLYDRTVGRNERAHRVSYALANGSTPDGDLDHTCHSLDKTCRGGPKCLHRRCCNPLHLEPVTNAENSRRGRAGVTNGGREAAKTHCPQGHPYEGANLRLDNRGWRHCRACAAARRRAERARASALRDASRPRR
jgi:hypothetical protein